MKKLKETAGNDDDDEQQSRDKLPTRIEIVRQRGERKLRKVTTHIETVNMRNRSIHFYDSCVNKS
jgi:hypothetical protein